MHLRAAAGRFTHQVALLAGGGIYAYSYGAMLWIGAVAFFVLAGDVLRRRELFSVIRRWWRCVKR